MTQLIKSFPAAPYHLAIFVAIVWRLYFVLSAPSFTIAACSLLWLVFRLHRVLCQPVEDLINILGIEVPSPPGISLLDLSEDTISMRWQPSEKLSNTKYWVWVNGAAAGEVQQQESAISVTALAAGVYYTIRVTACTHGKFLAESDPIRVRTTPLDTDDESDEGEVRISRTTMPAIVPYKGQHEGLSVPNPSPPLLREHSGSLSQVRRRVSLRKGSPNPNLGQWERRESDHYVDDSAGESVKSLTTTLDALRRDIAEQQRQDDEEEAQHQQEVQTLNERKEQLRRESKEKEDTSRDLKKSVAALERRNQAAQQKRAAQERALESKKSEHRRLGEDMEREEAEIFELREDMEAMTQEKSQLAIKLENELESLRIEREPEMEAVTRLEEQVRDVGKQVKELEDTRKENSEPADSPTVPEREVDNNQDVHDRIGRLKEELNHKIIEVQRARYYHTQLHAQLHVAGSHQRTQNTYDPNAAEFTPASHSLLGYTREPGRRDSLSGLGPSFPMSTAAEARNPFAMSLHPNVESGGLAPNDTHYEAFRGASLSPTDVERLTGGALASPSANALLPSDLLGDDTEDPSKRHKNRYSAQETDSMGSRTSSTAPPPGFDYHQALRETSNPLPGLGALPGLGSTAGFNQPGPHSPTAGESRSPSLTSSPHDSLYHRPSDGLPDSDRRSIRSTSSSSRPWGTGHPSRLLGDVFNRQRGKSTTDEGPTLGSLHSSESQSFPRQNSGDLGENGSGASQRRVHSGGLFSSMLNRRGHGMSRLGNSHDDTAHPLSGADDLGRLRSGGFPWANSSFEKGVSSRPTSVYSAENALPRQIGDGQQTFGWNHSGLGRSNTTLSGRGRMNAWSLNASRRGSSQVESNGLSEFDPVDEDVLPLADRNASAQAPIGTKPVKSKKKDESKDSGLGKQLNPNAGSFMSGMFSRDKKGDKRKEKSPSRPETSNASADDLGISGTPSAQEASVHSVAGSTDDVRSTSPRMSESGPPTPSDVTPTARESLMRKLTRKSSQLPGLKSRKTAGPSTPQTNAEDVDDGEAAAGQLARTPSSLTGSPKVSHEKEKERDKESIGKRSSGFSLNSFKRRSKKDKDAPSISEASVTSGTGDESVEADRSERQSTDD